MTIQEQTKNLDARIEMQSNLIDRYGDAEIWEFSLTFKNSFVKTDISIELR